MKQWPVQVQALPLAGMKQNLKRLRHMQRFIHFVLTFPGSSFIKLQGRHTVKRNSWHASLLQTSTWTRRGGRVAVWVGAVFCLLKWVSKMKLKTLTSNEEEEQQLDETKPCCGMSGFTEGSSDSSLWTLLLRELYSTPVGSQKSSSAAPQSFITELKIRVAELEQLSCTNTLSRQSFIYFKFHQLALCTLAGIGDFCCDSEHEVNIEKSCPRTRLLKIF